MGSTANQNENNAENEEELDSGQRENNSEESTDKRKKYSIGDIVKFVTEVSAAIAGVIGIIIVIYSISAKFTSQEKDIEYLEEDMENLEEDIDNFREEIVKINSGIQEFNNTVSDLALSVKEDHEIFLQLASKDTGEKPYKVVFKDVFQVQIETIGNEEYLAAPLWKDNENGIAIDADSDIIYSADDLHNTPILTVHTELGEEIYFLGRFNENNHWNGKCILNVYSGNKLDYIFEGIYDDGVLFSYKRIEDKGDYWLVNDRIYQGAYNSGETWKYTKYDDFTKSFSMEDVKEKQILEVNDFLKSQEIELLSYYRGNTANGLYNDKTGNAYLVSYFKNGELPGAEGETVIRTLYGGNFKDGKYDDDTGSAWYITREAITTYMYWQGYFKDGTVDHTVEIDKQNPADRDYIQNKLKEKGFGRYASQFWIEY